MKYYLNSSRPDFSDYKITSTSNTLLHQLIMFVTALYQVQVYMLSGHSAAQEIKHL
jgi:hypothetical protein